MTDFLTVKEFATAANVTTQRIYKLYAMGCTTECNGIATELHEYFKIENGKKYIHRDALRLFGNATELHNEMQPLATDNATRLHNVAQPFETALAALEKQLEAMQQQLAEKDKQLSEANAHITELTATIKAEQEHSAQLATALDNTTAALTAAQALHAGTIKQQLIEQHEPDSDLQAQEEQPTQELVEDPPKKKLSFFQKIFRRKEGE